MCSFQVHSIFYQISLKIRLILFEKVLNSAFHHRRVFPPTANSFFSSCLLYSIYVINDKQTTRWYTHWIILSDNGNHCRFFHHILSKSAKFELVLMTYRVTCDSTYIRVEFTHGIL